MALETPEHKPEDSNNEDSRELIPSEIKIPEEVEAVIHELPIDKQSVVKGLFVKMMIRESFRGPLPHPKTLREYDAIVPGSAERIIQRMEKQSDHRMDLESVGLKEDLKQSGRGQTYGFIIALVVFIVSAFLIYTGHDTAGTVLASVDLVALVSVFVIGKYSQKRDD